MTALEEIKKAFPNMFRPLKWHHFDGPTEHGCGEWYAHATRGMYHIYDVREKFPNDRPFYAKELSDQFDTLEQAQDAVQNRHELDIVMCLDPDFRSTLESLQRENEELRKGNNHIAAEKSGIAKNAHSNVDYWKSQFEAAEAEVKRLRAALEPFARYAGDPTHIKQRAFLQLLICPLGDDHPDNHVPYFQAAKAALASTGGEHNGN